MNDRFLRACRRQPVDATPVWFMRQAGRYMPEYRALREQYALLELCRTPELAAEVTLQPVDAIDVDAAILFSDLLLPLEPMGLAVRLRQGRGPAVDNPIRTAADVERLQAVRAARGARLRAGGDPPCSGASSTAGAAHRLRRRAVHARVLRHRRRAVEATSRGPRP